MRKGALFLAVILSTFLLAGSGVAGDTIKVGFVDTYTGPATTTNTATRSRTASSIT
jgi:hypothetical protein